jgi:N-acetylneuraminic acid mutarotase
VTGGENYYDEVIVSTLLASAEIYDPLAHTWSPASSMATARDYHTATLLPNGLVLVTGGLGSTGYTASAELYDPIANTWSPAGSMATARADHTATLLPNGLVLVAGGWGNGATPNSGVFLASAEIYDPVANTWSPAGSMATVRAGYTATLLPSGLVLAAGGDSDVTQLASADLYDPVANTWSPAGSMATARVYHTATLLVNGVVLVAVGNGAGTSSELYW